MPSFEPIDLLFILLILSMAIWVGRFTHRRLPFAYPEAPIVLAIWLGLQATLAARGFFQDFQSMPPRMGLLLLPNVVALILVARSHRIGAALSTFSRIPLILFQTFRVVVEICLHQLVRDGRLPQLMTYTGSNFDIAVALTAPLIAAAIYTQRPWAGRLATAWNFTSFAILSNTAIHGLLAAPTPFQHYFTSPTAALIAEFPWIWLPGFAVPLALLGHLLSIRQLNPRKSISSK